MSQNVAVSGRLLFNLWSDGLHRERTDPIGVLRHDFLLSFLYAQRASLRIPAKPGGHSG